MRVRGTPFFLLLAFCAALFSAAPRANAASCLVYVGSYTNWELAEPPRANAPGERSKGITVFRFDTETGKLTPLGLAAESINPTYVTFSASGKYLYATNEFTRIDGKATGAVSAFSIDADSGRLTLLNQVPAHGIVTCYAQVDKTGKNLLAANFGTGSAAVFPINPDGTLRPASAVVQDTGSGPSSRQAGPHSHAINLTPDNRLALVSEFGSDRLSVFRFDAAAGTLQPADPPHVPTKPGSAPRHLAFHPDGKTAYSLNEIDSTVVVLRYDGARGSFQEIQTLSGLPSDYHGQNTAAEVVVHPSGKFLYTSNRGHNSIAVFAIGSDGKLQLVANVPCGGRTPRGFAVDPTGRWMITATQATHTVVVFAIDPSTGIPAPTGASFPVHTPVCVKFLALSN